MIVSLRRPQMGVPSPSRESLVLKKKEFGGIVRSSNLSVKKTFTDQDRDAFRLEAIEYLAQFLRTLLGNCRREIHI